MYGLKQHVDLSHLLVTSCPPKVWKEAEVPTCSSVASSSNATQRHSLLREAAFSTVAAQPVPHVHVVWTRQRRFDQGLMHAAHAVARLSDHCLPRAARAMQRALD